MAILINKKTGAEHQVDNPEEIMAKYRGKYSLKPSAQLSDEVKSTEQKILNDNLDDLAARVPTIGDATELKTLLDAEISGKNRAGAKKLFNDRIAELEASANDAKSENEDN